MVDLPFAEIHVSKQAFIQWNIGWDCVLKVLMNGLEVCKWGKSAGPSPLSRLVFEVTFDVAAA